MLERKQRGLESDKKERKTWSFIFIINILLEMKIFRSHQQLLNENTGAKQTISAF